MERAPGSRHARYASAREVAAARPHPLAAVLAEVVGTFMLTFSGTAAVLATHKLHPQEGMDDVAISLAFALGIVAAIWVSGCERQLQSLTHVTDEVELVTGHPA
jgi:formate/nitrite transporter FocA (FNT family)